MGICLGLRTMGMDNGRGERGGDGVREDEGDKSEGRGEGVGGEYINGTICDTGRDFGTREANQGFVKFLIVCLVDDSAGVRFDGRSP